mmetsp:Transcript_9650/g.33188  ORF Transcript_9650/g.33188 Transcript_9650/m.33188 type:complete len:210 (-) Transcript_9650:273-902(-)
MAQRVFASSLQSTASSAARMSPGTSRASGGVTAAAASTAWLAASESCGSAPSKKAPRQKASGSSKEASLAAHSRKWRRRSTRGRMSAERPRNAAGAWCAQSTARASSSAARSVGTATSATTRALTPLRSRSAAMAADTMLECFEYSACRANGASRLTTASHVRSDGAGRAGAPASNVARRRAAPLASSRLSSETSSDNRGVHAPAFDGW